MRLYEFSLIKRYEDGKVRELKYQVPAKSKTDAFMRMGRSHPHPEDNDYEIEVVSCELANPIAEGLARQAMTQAILDHEYLEPDYDREHGECNSRYQIRNLFSCEGEAIQTVGRILDAHSELTGT